MRNPAYKQVMAETQINTVKGVASEEQRDEVGGVSGAAVLEGVKGVVFDVDGTLWYAFLFPAHFHPPLLPLYCLSAVLLFA